MMHANISDFVERVKTWDPRKEGGDATIRYIDIGSVSQLEKAIVTPPEINAIEAPSRARQLVKRGDILVSTVRPNLNAVALVPDDLEGATASTGFSILRPDETVLHGNYLFHWVRSPAFIDEMMRRATGQSYPAVSDKIVKASKIPLPPLEEQKRIAGALDQADALRRLRTRALDKLNTLGQAIFHEMFGDLIANEHEFQLVEVGDMIKGFETGKNLAQDPDAKQSDGYRVLKISAVTSGIFKPEESKPLPPSYEPPQAHIVKDGDLLFSRANTEQLIGATAFVRTDNSNLALPDKLWRFVWKQETEVLPEFVKELFSSPAFRIEIGKRSSGTSGSMKNIGKQKVMTIRFGLPNMDKQREFSSRLSAVNQQATNGRRLLKASETLFASLQHRAFQGEL